MSEDFKTKCKKLWNDLDRELGSVLHMWSFGNGAQKLLGTLRGDQCKQISGNDMDQEFLKDWGNELKKLKERNRQLENLDQLQSQLSTAQQSAIPTLKIR